MHRSTLQKVTLKNEKVSQSDIWELYFHKMHMWKRIHKQNKIRVDLQHDIKERQPKGNLAKTKSVLKKWYVMASQLVKGDQIFSYQGTFIKTVMSNYLI